MRMNTICCIDITRYSLMQLDKRGPTLIGSESNQIQANTIERELISSTNSVEINGVVYFVLLILNVFIK